MTTKEVFVCDTCGKGFDTHMALLGHQGFHKNSGRYKCELCSLEDGMDVVFTLPQGLGAHMKAKHGVEGTGNRRERNERYRAKAKLQKLMEEREPVVVAPELIDLHEDPKLVGTNGSGEIGAAIALAFAPLERQYQLLQERQLELVAEQQQIEDDLGKLWEVLQGRGTVTPPPNAGVQVGFRKEVSDSLSERAESWIANRRTAFTVADLSRGIAISNSAAAKIVAIMRDSGGVRLVGKKRQANAYVGA